MNRLKQFRTRQKLTMEQLAATVGCHKVDIARYESGSVRPAIDRALLIAKALDTTAEEIFGVNNDEAESERQKRRAT